jgi:hypothetical protein
MEPGTKLLLGVAAGAAIVWYGWAMAYVFLHTGTLNRGGQDPQLNNQIGTVIGVSVIGSLVVAVGLIVLSYQWVNILYKAIIGIIFAFVALTLSITAMSITSITH